MAARSCRISQLLSLAARVQLRTSHTASAPDTPALEVSVVQVYQQLLAAERRASVAERKEVEARLRGEKLKAELELQAEKLKAELTVAGVKLQAVEQVAEAQLKVAGMEVQGLRIETMAMKGRLHARGLLEEAEDMLKKRHSARISDAVNRSNLQLSRAQMYRLLAQHAANDNIIKCMVNGATEASKEIGAFGANMYQRLSDSVHAANQTSRMVGEPILIVLDGVLTATESNVLACIAKTLQVRCEIKRLVLPQAACRGG